MDYQVFFQILKTALIKYRCVLHAYCLMTNHIHLLLETCDMEIGKFMSPTLGPGLPPFCFIESVDFFGIVVCAVVLSQEFLMEIKNDL